MADREFTFLVLGASGFTGLQVCLHLARGLPSGKYGPNFRWAVGGRSAQRLEDTVLRALRSEGLTQPQGIVVVDNFDDAGLRAALPRARLVLNCTGPYKFMGAPVVHACVDTGTHYMDLCGEPDFMDQMVLKHHQEAMDKGVLVLHACAFDSVPADMGCIFTARQFGPTGVCSSIQSFMSLSAGPAGACLHYTTYEAAVHGFAGVGNLRRLRNDLAEEFPPPKIPRVGPRPPPRDGPFWVERMGAYAFKFPGADAAVVRSTQTALARIGKAEGLCPHYSCYFVLQGVWNTFLLMLFGGTFQTLAKSKWGRDMLLKHPEAFTNGTFTRQGPSQEQLEQTSFSITFVAQGTRGQERGAQGVDAAEAGEAAPLSQAQIDRTVVTTVSGPEPGYVATPIMFLALARCLLEEKDTLPVQGGVYTPGAVFAESNLVDRLQQEGIEFKVIESD